MCFIKELKNFPARYDRKKKKFGTLIEHFNVAENDIRVVKVVRVKNGIIKAYFRRLRYHVGKTYSITIDKIIKGIVVVRSWQCNSLATIGIKWGFHSYKENMISWTSDNHFWRLQIWIMNTTIPIETYFGDVYLMYCHIPKGSHYIVNDKGEVVSDTLVVDSVEKVMKD